MISDGQYLALTLALGASLSSHTMRNKIASLRKDIVFIGPTISLWDAVGRHDAEKTIAEIRRLTGITGPSTATSVDLLALKLEEIAARDAQARVLKRLRIARPTAATIRAIEEALINEVAT